MTTDVVSNNEALASPAPARDKLAVSASTRIFGAFREWRGSAFLMLLTDVIALEACIFLGLLTRIALDSIWPISMEPEQYKTLAMGVLAMPIALFLLGFYPGYGVNQVQRLRQRVHGIFALYGLLVAWNYLVQKDDWSRGVLLASLLFAIIIPAFFEAVVRDLMIRCERWGQPIVILGAGKVGQDIAQMLRRRPELGMRPIGFFDDDRAKQNTTIDGLPVLGTLKDATGLPRDAIKTALLAIPRLDGKHISRLVESLPFHKTIVVPGLFGLQSVWLSPVDLEGIVGLSVRNNLKVHSNYLIKRTLDLVVSIPLALFCLPVIIIAGIMIKLADGGPIFFAQERSGLHGKPINVLKLRTMYVDAQSRLERHLAADPAARAEWQRYFKLKKDPRILPGIGQILRRTSLDELPQIRNVLRGEMSLVGPRPFPDYHLKQFSEEFQTYRCSVPQGLTGLWQVSARSDGDLKTQEILDTYYIRNWSLWLDIYILIRTVTIVICGKGAY